MGAFELGWAQGERRNEERQGRKDEQRQAELQTIGQSGLTPEQQAEAIRTLYQKDPSALKQHIENLFRRIGGKQTQPTPQAYPGQADTQSERRAQILSEGKSSEQQKLDAYKGQLGAQQEAQLGGAEKTMAWLQSLPPEQQHLASSILGIYPRPTLKEYSSPDGKQRQWFDANDAGAIPEGWQATAGTGSLKPAKGTMVKSKQSPTGYAQTWVDPHDPSKVVAWQPITPSRWYTGFTSASTTTDPFGVTSSTSHVTNPQQTGEVDLSGATPLPPDQSDVSPADSGSPTAAPTAAPQAQPAAPAPRKGAAPKAKAQPVKEAASPELDASGHVPPSAGNPGLVEAANQLLDGMDITKLQLPQRDKQAAAALAGKYGWSQGTFTPKEKVLLKEAGTFINEASTNKALAVLDNPASRARLATLIGDVSRSGTWHNLFRVAASQGATPEEIEFLRMYNQLVGTISGLGQLTRSGRITEATIGRLMQELPNPVTTQSASDAKSRLQRLKNEIAVAADTAGNKQSAAAPKVRKWNPDKGDFE